MSLIHAARYNASFEEDSNGDFFSNGSDFRDLSKIKILMSSVDTVRQLYRSKVKPEFLEKCEQCISTSRSQVHKFTISGNEFVLGGGGASRYQYRLQNNEIGLIVLVKSSNIKADTIGTHIKIECSPTLLLRRSAGYVQDLMDSIVAELAIGDFEYQGLAIHLAVDVQGWEPAKDFAENLVCRSGLRVVRDGIDTAEFTVSDVSVTYGGGQSMTFGSPSAVQMACYDKVKQMKVIDKSEFYKAAWSGNFSNTETSSDFDTEGTVRRIEMRFHHSVINQFHEGLITSEGIAGSMKSYRDIFEHLDGLWRYAMAQFKLMRTKERYALEWTKFTQDAVFNQTDIVYKRVRKEKGGDNAKNVALALGNLISICARNGMPSHKVLNMLRNSCIWEDVLRYFRDKGFDRNDIKLWLSDALIKRRMLGNAA